MPPIADVPTAETCACGGKHWHAEIAPDLWFCKLCGSIRLPGEDAWHVPIDASRLLPNAGRTYPLPEDPRDDEPTRPGTPGAKRGR